MDKPGFGLGPFFFPAVGADNVANGQHTELFTGEVEYVLARARFFTGDWMARPNPETVEPSLSTSEPDQITILQRQAGLSVTVRWLCPKMCPKMCPIDLS
jgi:hypothetical protein